MAIKPKFKPGDLVYMTHDGYDFLGLVKSANWATKRGNPVNIEIEWCGLSPKIFPSNYVPQQYLRRVDKQ